MKLYVMQLAPLAAEELDRGLVLTPGLLENSPSDCTAQMFLSTRLRSATFKEIIHILVQFAFHLIPCGSKFVRKKERKNSLLSFSYISYLLSNIVSWIALEYSKKLSTGI